MTLIIYHDFEIQNHYETTECQKNLSILCKFPTLHIQFWYFLNILCSTHKKTPIIWTLTTPPLKVYGPNMIMLLVLDMYHTWKFLLNIWWPAGWRWKVNKGGWPCYSRRQWLPHSSSQMEHVKKVDPGPGERWVDLYDALRINPTQALQTHNVKVVWKCDSVTSSLFLGKFK